MGKFWISLYLLVTLGAAILAQNDDVSNEYDQDYLDQWYQDEVDKIESEWDKPISGEHNEETLKEVDVKVSSDSQNDDYQIEDNRDMSEERKRIMEETKHILINDDDDNLEEIPAVEGDLQVQDIHEIIKETKDLLGEMDDSKSEALENVEDAIDDDRINEVPAVDDSSEIVKETKDLLGEMYDSKSDALENVENAIDDDRIDEVPAVDDSSEIVRETKDLLNVENSKISNSDDKKSISDEIKDILEEIKNVQDSSDDLDDEVKNQNINEDSKALEEESEKDILNKVDNKNILEENVDKIKEYFNVTEELKRLYDEGIDSPEKEDTDIQNLSSENSNNKDNLEDAYDDLNDNLDKLIRTIEKFSGDDNKQTVNENESNKNEVLDYEEKYDRPFREGAVLQFKLNELNDVDEDESDSEDSDDTKENLTNNFPENIKSEKNPDDAFDGNGIKKSSNNLDSNSKQLSEDDFEAEQAIDTEVSKIKSGLETAKLAKLQTASEAAPSSILEIPKNYTDEELTKLMSQFVVEHADEIDADHKDFDRNIAAVNIPINYIEAIVICSPGYPDPYPDNNIVDWIFDGDGMGVEINITEFALNDILQDFLLVKPGGEDASGADGLVFAYTITSAPRYRFMDVDRVFMRFHAHPGLNRFLGFCFSIKMMGPRPLPPAPTPPPGPTAPEILHTHTLFFGSVTPAEFQPIREEFRLILADMATLYINSNGLSPGEMTTGEVTNITRVSVCNLNWPNVDNCAAITFGVPLLYPEDEEYRLHANDLERMWSSYRTREPFATRIARLGLTDFLVPNDGGVLAVWLAIGAAVLLTAIMIAFALWKWDIFEDYTRMATMSDTDSVLSRKQQDPGLYPTPYQDLPALYADQRQVYDYKFPGEDDAPPSVRVDMGGFSNKSYMTDGGLYELDSDDDIKSSTRNRNSAPVSPRDIYEN